MPDQFYWDDVFEAFRQQPGGALWRASCDSIYSELIQNWLGSERIWGKVLKTDLFDEAVSEGLFPQLSRIAEQVHGIDLSPKVVAAAKSRHPELNVECGDARNLPYADKSFDLVFSNSSLDHFKETSDLQRAIDELYRVLKPSGYLLITLDNLDNPVIAVRRALPINLLQRLGLAPFFPGVTLNGAGLRRALHASGFSIDSQRTIMHAPRIVAVKLAALFNKGPSWLKESFKTTVKGLECLENWPGSRVTGYYVAALAIKSDSKKAERTRARKPPFYRNVLVRHPINRFSQLGRKAAAELAQQEPIIVMGRGHSGTRIVSVACERLGVKMGADLERHPSGDPVDRSFKHHQRQAACLVVSDSKGGGLRRDIYNLVQKSIWDYYQRLQPEGPWGWKFPESYLLGFYLAEICPRAKFVHLTRDGRDIAFKRHLTDAPEHRLARLILQRRDALKSAHHLQAAHSWAFQVELFQEFSRGLPAGKVLHLRYEDFMTKPLRCGETLARFLKLEMTEACRLYLLDKIDPQRAGRFREQPPHLVKQVEDQVGDVLTSLGYLPTAPLPLHRP